MSHLESPSQLASRIRELLTRPQDWGHVGKQSLSLAEDFEKELAALIRADREKVLAPFGDLETTLDALSLRHRSEENNGEALAYGHAALMVRRLVVPLPVAMSSMGDDNPEAPKPSDGGGTCPHCLETLREDEAFEGPDGNLWHQRCLDGWREE